MSWIAITIFAYFLLAVTSIIDKFLLTGPRLTPKTYAFYVSFLLSVFALILIPFGVNVPDVYLIIIALLSGAVWIFAVLALYESLRMFEVSRIIPAIGGVLPIFVLGLSYFFAFLENQKIESLSPMKVLSFLFLVIGTVLINAKRQSIFDKKALGVASLTAFLFSISFITAKIVYLSEPFISGLFWTRISAIPITFLFLGFFEVRQQVFCKKEKIKNDKKPKILLLFILSQSLGSLAIILQNWVISIIPMIQLAFMNALEGTRYVFLLVFIWIVSLKFPKILEEKFSFLALVQKIFSIILITLGLVLLSLD